MNDPAFATFREAFVAGDGDRLADAFITDGLYATNIGVLLEGRAQIRAGAMEWFRRRPPGAVVELEVDVIRSDAADRSRWELIEYRQHGFVAGEPGAGTLDESGYALAVYRADHAGAWRIESLVVNLRPGAA